MNITKLHLILIYFLIWKEGASISGSKELDYLLPSNYLPQNYNLILSIDPDKDKFSGELIVEFMLLTKTTSIFLHASPTRINITQIDLDYHLPCKASYLSKETEILNISCPTDMQKNDIHKLIIDYEGVFGTTGVVEEYLGLYKSTYETTEGIKNYAVSQFEPTYARTAFPCFDQPQFKTPFQITIKHPSNYSVLSNTNTILTTSGTE